MDKTSSSPRDFFRPYSLIRNPYNEWPHLSGCSLHSDDVALGLVQHLDGDSDNRHFKLVGLLQQFRQLDLKNVSPGHKSFLKKVTLHFTSSLRSS